MGLFNKGVLDRIGKRRREWEEGELKQALARSPESRRQFRTLSGIEVGGLYTPGDVGEQDFEDRLGFPGAYPFTRGGVPHHVPRQAMDAAPDRRVRYGPFHQRAVPIPAGPWTDGPEHRLRPPNSDRIRLR